MACRAGLSGGVYCVVLRGGPAGVCAAIPIYPCWRHAVGGEVGRWEKISIGLGQIRLTLPAATEYIPTGEGQI